MEAENKVRKRGDADDADRSKKGKPTRGEGAGGAGGLAAVPSEAEVEEFYAILRRMQVAVRYFERSGGNGESNERSKRWRTVLETGEIGGRGGGEGDVVGRAEKKKSGVGIGDFDLNAAPEESSGGD